MTTAYDSNTDLLLLKVENWLSCGGRCGYNLFQIKFLTFYRTRTTSWLINWIFYKGLDYTYPLKRIGSPPVIPLYLRYCWTRFWLSSRSQTIPSVR